MLASVSTDVQTNGDRDCRSSRPDIPRAFVTSPTRDNRQIDIVIAVTPRVLRAPAVNPRDEEMRPSGTLQAPTPVRGRMIRDADREDHIAAARCVADERPNATADRPLEKASEKVRRTRRR